VPDKIFRDPLYNYISIDKDRDGWLLALLDTPEVQRLRRIHQLGVSNITYPGADHSRLVHSLGVVHLMLQVLHQLEAQTSSEKINRARQPLLAAALLHDVGHGPFSHLFEPCLGIDHEVWSKKIILDESSAVNRVLRREDEYLPVHVADLIDKDNNRHPWQKALLSSQLDVDRVDYLRRDSLFTGAGYGHFDWFRLMTTVQLSGDGDEGYDLVWPEKAAMAIEEYIFARYYMYQNVYLHKTTRGFEALLKAMWNRAHKLRTDGTDTALVPVLADFWSNENQTPTTSQYLRIEEFTVLSQIQAWTSHSDRPLADLARRFRARDGLVVIDPPRPDDELTPDYSGWDAALKEIVMKHGYAEPDMYCLVDTLGGKYRQPYFPEKEHDEQSVRNAIRVIPSGGGSPVEITQLPGMKRLQAVTQKTPDQRRYYVPKEVRAEALKLAADRRQQRHRPAR
jgi:HD superfamily phosphohydrolase